jgi:protein phosphatase
VLDLEDVLGKRIITTRLHHSVTVREENAIAALEVMSRFAANPKWLIYLPPTMSPTQTTAREGLLEHPEEAFDYFRSSGVDRVICQEKHMGSRAVVVVCRDESIPQKRFGVREDDGGGIGIIYTRTGRRFFDDRELEQALLARLHAAVTAADIWEELNTNWLCLDCELMPWSAKAQELLQNQYAAVGSAARGALTDVVPVLQQADARYGGEVMTPLLLQHQQRRQQVNNYVDAYRRYCWPVRGVDDLKLAPFHLLASEDHVHVDKDHAWQMSTLAKLADADGGVGATIMATANETFALDDSVAVAHGIAWWESLTSRGGEGMVVKPLDFVVRGKKGLVQPAIKCRGKEYLRIIYGPAYDSPENLPRLRNRRTSAKRSLALREFALGVEALERFVRREPLRRVHECVFAVLALESEPVDPRL